MTPGDFTYTDAPQPHHERTRGILQAHPEVRDLVGNNPWTFLILAGILALQWTIAFLLKDGPWWLVVLVAYAVGAFASHGLFVIIHEAGHDMVFKRKWANRLAGIMADLGNMIPSAISFSLYHQKHHAYFGDYVRDADLAYKWEARLVGDSVLRKALWLLAFPLVEGIRPIRMKGVQFINGWTILNWIIVFTFDALIVMFVGPAAFLYLLLSLVFGIGLHPLGARWIQEHYLVAPPQETYSYYGIINKINMNIGYHNEHHDIPSIPWNRLPALKKIAPEWYDNLYFHTSYARLLWQFLTDKKLTLFSRIVHTYR